MSKRITYPLIGLVGTARHGKSTVANWFVSQRQYKEFAFAAGLKDACKIIFGLTDEQLHGSLKNTIDPFLGATPRRILQRVGSDLFRDQLPFVLPELPLQNGSIWMLRFDKFYAETTPSPIIVSDVRFRNEAENIKSKGGILLRIIRPDHPGCVNELDHISEQESDGIEHDICVVNDGSVEDLYKQLDKRFFINETNFISNEILYHQASY